MLEKVLEEFGESLGFNGLALNEQGTADIEVEEDRLELQLVGDELLMIYIVDESRLDRKGILQDLLLLPHPDNLNPFPLQVGSVAGSHVFFIARILVDGVGADHLTQALEFLWEIKNSLFY